MEHFGVLFTCPTGAHGGVFADDAVGRGSHDMQTALEHLEQRSEFKEITTNPGQADTNISLVKDFCMSLLVSRLAVIRKVLDSQPADLSSKERKRDCGIVQLDPTLFCSTPGHPDIYERLLRVLRCASPYACEWLLNHYWEGLCSDYPDLVEDCPLFIDEAQALASKFGSAHFLSASNRNKSRPLLTPVVENLMKPKIFTRCVISGISLSPKIFDVALQSTTARLNSRIVELTMADGFFDKAGQRRYIEHKLRPWADEIGISEESFDYLVVRMTLILRGR